MARPLDAEASSLLATLRGDIAYGMYHPHERLIETELMLRYRASRAAVREALIALVAERLAERQFNRGARIRGMSLAEAIEISEVRRELESFCAARAAALSTHAERNHFLALAESLRASAATDSNAYLVLNARYHATIVALARHSTAGAILERIHRRPIDLLFPGPFRSMPLTDWVDAHVDIAMAIASGDPEAAHAQMYGHMTHLIDRLRRIESSGSSPA